MLDFGVNRSPYVEYGEFDTLLTLQKPRSASRHELLFITSGQLMELLFKLMTHELSQVQDRLRADDVVTAVATLERVIRIEEVLVKAWDMVGTLTSDQFVEFRDELGAASGFQSPGHRKLEFLLGNKDPEMLRPHRGYTAACAELERSLRAPSVYDDALALLARRGYPVAHEHLGRDLSAPYRPHPSAEEAWLAVYADQGPSDDLRRLSEALTRVADLWKQWRHRHLVTVARVIGQKPGTGGTSGVEWLRRVSELEVFPELWTMRTRM